MERNCKEKTIEQTNKNKQMNFETKQNAVGFFSVLLRVAKRNPDLWEEICKNSSKNSEKTAKNNN